MLAACDIEEVGLVGAARLVQELRTECQVSGAIVLECMAYTSSS
jgi:hypothetical protein